MPAKRTRTQYVQHMPQTVIICCMLTTFLQVEHGQHGGGQHGGGGGYQFTSVNSSRPMAAEPYRQPAPEPVQQHMPAPSNPTRPAKPNSSQAANQWDKPPKITASKRAPARVETSRGGESVADRSARLTDHIQVRLQIFLLIATD